jgi:hypothetical protein
MTMTTSTKSSSGGESTDDLQETLISLPLCDLQSITPRVGDSVSTRSLNENEDTFPPLLLMQVPSSSIQQLISCKTYFLGNGGSDSTSSTSRACLVMEAPSAGEGSQTQEEYCGKSFLLNRVETSNSLILIPSINTSCSAQEQQHIDKKIRGAERYEQVGRLVNPSSFLEVKRKTLDKQQLHDLLYQDCISRQKRKKNATGGLTMRLSEKNGGCGYTVSQLAYLLQSSVAEVKDGLAELGAFEICNMDDQVRNSTRYTFLSDETVQDIMRSIFATLVEYPELVTNQDMEPKLHKEECISQVLTLVKQEDEDSSNGDDFDVNDIVQYCLNLISASTNSPSDEQPSMALDMNKVAIHLAHEIFQQRQRQKNAGNEVDVARQSVVEVNGNVHFCWPLKDFQEEWSRYMPFTTGQDPSLDLLRGIALKIKQPLLSKNRSSHGNPDATQNFDDQMDFLLYFPERSLPLDTKRRFEKMFAFREEWTLEELEPYIKCLVSKQKIDGSLTQAELLLKYTRVITKDDGSTVHRIRK